MVNKTIMAAIALAFALAGCDLEEAERMDLTRSGVQSIDPSFGGARFRGSSTIPLRLLVDAIRKDSAGVGWSFEWEDAGTVRADTSLLCVQALLGNEPVFQACGPNWWNVFTMQSAPELWLDRAEGLAFELYQVDRTYGTYTRLAWDPNLRIVDDRPKLDFTPPPSVPSTVQKGDTVTLVVRNPNSETVKVFSDHSGLRTVGDYVTVLAPGQSARLRWVVTARPGTPVLIDLGWGEWGGLQRFEYRLLEP